MLHVDIETLVIIINHVIIKPLNPVRRTDWSPIKRCFQSHHLEPRCQLFGRAAEGEAAGLRAHVRTRGAWHAAPPLAAHVLACTRVWAATNMRLAVVMAVARVACLCRMWHCSTVQGPRAHDAGPSRVALADGKCTTQRDAMRAAAHGNVQHRNPLHYARGRPHVERQDHRLTVVPMGEKYRVLPE